MLMPIVVKIQKTINNQYTFNVPAKIVEARGIKKGDRFFLEETANGNFIYVPVPKR